MICEHDYIQIPHTTYQWCTNCGTVQEPGAMRWQSRIYNQVLAQDVQLTAEEKQLVRENKKIYAIKMVRERSGLGLKESKDIVDAYQLEWHRSLPPNTPSHEGDLTEVEKDYCRAGMKINAIKCVRERTGLSLRDALNIVDEWISRNLPPDGLLGQGARLPSSPPESPSEMSPIVSGMDYQKNGYSWVNSF